MPANEIEIATPQINFDAIKSFIEGFEVKTNEQYLLAGNERITLGKRRAEVVEFYKDVKASAYSTWKKIIAQEKFFTDKIDAFESLLNKKMKAFRDEEDRIRREHEAVLQAEADAKVEAERKRLLKNAKANKKRGNVLNTEMYREAAANVAAPIVSVASTIPKVAGIVERKIRKAEIINKQAFISAVSANPDLLIYVSIDTVGLAKARFNDLPGIRFYEEEISYSTKGRS